MVLAGDGDLLEPTKTLAAELGLTGEQVKFIGFRKDIKNLYKGADLYINSSRHEALSFLIVEAMDAKIDFDLKVNGNPDILKGPEDGGLLVKYDDPDSMAQAMKQMMEDPALLDKCKANALARVADEFEVHKMCDATYSIYEKALRG